MDPVSFYSGTGRELTLGFRVVSDDIKESELNMEKIQKLIQYQYPTYRSLRGAKVLQSPPYFRFEFLNLLKSKTSGDVLEGYINGAIQISPGFQTKDQAQFFSQDYKNIYFSDVTITLRMQVLHQGTIGWTGKEFTHELYPYGVGETEQEPTSQSSRPTQITLAVDAADPDTAAVQKTPDSEQEDKRSREEKINRGESGTGKATKPRKGKDKIIMAITRYNQRRIFQNS